MALASHVVLFGCFFYLIALSVFFRKKNRKELRELFGLFFLGSFILLILSIFYFVYAYLNLNSISYNNGKCIFLLLLLSCLFMIVLAFKPFKEYPPTILLFGFTTIACSFLVSFEIILTLILTLIVFYGGIFIDYLTTKYF